MCGYYDIQNRLDRNELHRIYLEGLIFKNHIRCAELKNRIYEYPVIILQ